MRFSFYDLAGNLIVTTALCTFGLPVLTTVAGVSLTHLGLKLGQDIYQRCTKPKTEDIDDYNSEEDSDFYPDSESEDEDNTRYRYNLPKYELKKLREEQGAFSNTQWIPTMGSQLPLIGQFFQSHYPHETLIPAHEEPRRSVDVGGHLLRWIKPRKHVKFVELTPNDERDLRAIHRSLRREGMKPYNDD